MQASLAPTPVGLFVADMEVDMVADMMVDIVTNMELDMVSNMEVAKVADMEDEGGHNFIIMTRFHNSYQISQIGQFGTRIGRGGWLIGPKLFRPEVYPACASSKLSEFINSI